MILELIFGAVVLISFLIFKYLRNDKLYFEERNVKYKNLWFGLHNFYLMIAAKVDVFQFAQRHYDEYPDEP